MSRRLLFGVLLVLGTALLASCVYIANLQPIAIFTATPTHGTTPLAVQFDATASYDPDGALAAFLWDFGDGQTASTSVFPFAHVFIVQSTSEVFTVVLTVTDLEGAQDTAVQNVTVDP
ncbi:MAG: PKD domain-containing protein [Candidatus Bipolaricaulota bacterium]